MPNAYPAVCFASRRAAAPAPARQCLPLRLATAHQEALSELLPILLCGEESAALAFAGFAAESGLPPQARVELERIAADEQRHEQQLQTLRLLLPRAVSDGEVSRAARRLFARLGRDSVGVHLARIAALDSGACVVLGVLRAHRAPLSGDAAVSAMFARIHGDESRHVAVSRRYARSLLDRRQAHTVAAHMREQLAALISLRGAAFETLGVNADRLLARLRLVPRRLFT